MFIFILKKYRIVNIRNIGYYFFVMCIKLNGLIYFMLIR